eukprot:9429258-Alexandrium_andersonii.AAC.1
MAAFSGAWRSRAPFFKVQVTDGQGGERTDTTRGWTSIAGLQRQKLTTDDLSPAKCIDPMGVRPWGAREELPQASKNPAALQGGILRRPG